MYKILFRDVLCVLVFTIVGMTVLFSCALLVPSDVPYKSVLICSSAFLAAAGTVWGIFAEGASYTTSPEKIFDRLTK